MYEHILVPYDGTEEAEKGARHAIDLAATVGASIHALYVVDLPGAPRTPYVRDDEEELREQYREYGEEVTGDLSEMAAEQDVDCQTAIRSGSIHEEINDYAEEEGMDLIVLGTAYRGKVGALLGGLAEKVVRTSPTPVTTVRMQRDE
ncbi:MAG: universal stress protein [Salinirussus sp.]